jgi:hypothetical protein
MAMKSFLHVYDKLIIIKKNNKNKEYDIKV